MLLNYSETQRILDGLSDLINMDRITISTENTHWQGKPCCSDYVTFEKEHGIGLEVFDSETRVDFFDDHQHFGRYYSGEEHTDYAQDTIGFLRRLLSESLVKIETFRGRKRIRYEWFFLNAEGRKDSIAGPWLAPLLTFANPFRRKTCVQSFWRYQPDFGRFVQVDDDTVSLHPYDWDILIHIHRCGNGYSYALERFDFDEDEDVLNYYWAPLDTPGKSIYDSAEKALRAAKEAAKLHARQTQ